MQIIKTLPRNEKEFKYLQLNLIVDAIDDYIEELKSSNKLEVVTRRIADLRVYRKSFQQ